MLIRPVIIMIAVWDVHGGWGFAAFLCAISLFFE